MEVRLRGREKTCFFHCQKNGHFIGDCRIDREEQSIEHIKQNI